MKQCPSRRQQSPTYDRTPLPFHVALEGSNSSCGLRTLFCSNTPESIITVFISMALPTVQKGTCRACGNAGDAKNNSQASLLSLPPELHLSIANRLIYPDALSLKHTSRHFYNIVDTGVELKIDWLVSRRKLHLECPNDRGCDLGSDLRFCRGSVA